MEKVTRLVLEHIWPLFRPEAPEVPASITTNPIYTGWSAHYGETAVFLYDKRLHGGRAAAALQRMVSPEMIDYFTPVSWGEKEFPWLSVELAGIPHEMNPYMADVIGHEFDEGSVCCIRYLVAQLVPGATPGAPPRVFYLNGDRNRRAIVYGENEPWSCIMAPPRTYDETAALGFHKDCCSPGPPVAVPGSALARLLDYRRLYYSFGWKEDWLARLRRRPGYKLVYKWIEERYLKNQKKPPPNLTSVTASTSLPPLDPSEDSRQEQGVL